MKLITSDQQKGQAHCNPPSSSCKELSRQRLKRNE
jgi:hypothetical protein